MPLAITEESRYMCTQCGKDFLSKDMPNRDYILAKEEGPLHAVWLSGLRWHHFPNDDRHLNDLMPVVRSHHHVLVIGGWDEPSYLLLWLYGVVRRKKILFWIETTMVDYARKGVKEAFKRILLRHSEGCIVPGKRASEYCLALGVPEKKIFVAPNAADHSFFMAQADRLEKRRSEIRSTLGIDGLGVLFVGRLVEEYKGLSVAINAMGKIRKRGLNANLMVAGEGPDRTLYEEMAAKQGNGNIHFLGQLSQNQLCEYYAAADTLMLPSRSEAWGFVLNEGMEFGLPLVVSEAVGAGPDLVHPGENGFVFPVGDSDRLAEILELLIRDESLRKRMGQASKKIIEDFTPEAWAQGVVKAIEAVTSRDV